MKFVPRELNETADASRGKSTRGRSLKAIATFCVRVTVVYFLLGLCADLVANHIPERWEAQIFSFTSVLDRDDNKSAAFREAEAIFARLVESPQLRPLPYKLYLLDAPEPNAFALGGGAVGVTSGLLDLVEGEVGLATVLAHELADEFGLRLVDETYGEATGALEFFEKMHVEYESGRSVWVRLLSSHPPTSDRLDYLRELQQALETKAER